MIMMRQMHA